MTTSVLLDTCAAIWITHDMRLSEGAVKILDAAADAGVPVYVSPITAWEVGLQMSIGRLTVTSPARKWFAALSAIKGVRVLDLSTELLLDSTDLPGAPPKDPADRIIIATARAHDLRIVTRDRAILSYADKGHVLAIAC